MVQASLDVICSNTFKYSWTPTRYQQFHKLVNMAEIVARAGILKAFKPSLESALQSFSSSSEAFRVVRTIDPPGPSQPGPKTLYILDSSFNPPSVAHLSLATSAIFRENNPDSRPYRLLLLFSTQNADKAPSPASFEERLVMMTALAEDLADNINRGLGNESRGTSGSLGTSQIPIDVGLTTAPYYTDKSVAISNSGTKYYKSKPVHIHLLGYDTLTRFLAPKYYPTHSPPLSALAPFFNAGHKLLVTERPASASDSSSSSFGSVEEQRSFVHNLSEGSLESDGFKKAWAPQVEMVPAGAGVGVSSTKVRRAATKQDWAEVEKLCTPTVAGLVKDLRSYDEDARGAKMA